MYTFCKTMSALAEASLFARRIAPKGARSWSRALPSLEVGYKIKICVFVSFLLREIF